MVKNIFEYEVAEAGNEVSQKMIKTESEIEVLAFELDLVNKNNDRVGIIAGEEESGIPWILIISMDYSLGDFFPSNKVLAMLKNPTTEAIRKLKTRGKYLTIELIKSVILDYIFH